MIRHLRAAFGLIVSFPLMLCGATVGHWRFENTSSPGEDSGANGLTLTNHGVVVTDGRAEFEADENRYLSLADNDLLEFSDFTVEAYVQVESFGSASTARAIVSQMNTATPGNTAWQFGVTGSSSGLGARRPFIQLSGNGSAFVSFTPGSSFALTAGKNYYLAASVRFTGTGIETVFYLKNLTDGGDFVSAAGTTTSTTLPTGIFNSTVPLLVGASHNNGAVSRHFDGMIDELRISNMVLPAIDLLPGEDVGEPPVTPLRTEILSYRSSVSTDAGGALDLKAELNYDNSRSNAPVMVLMHPFSGPTGHFDSYRLNAMRMRDAGFFVISPAMRGREGSDGVRDNGGVEIHDIYDAVEALKIAHPTKIDATNISIIGYSGGGGNVMSALTKFPDYFRVGAAYFGMSDYGHDTVNGWYFNGAGDRVSTLNAAPGNPTPPAPQLVTDSYHARASNLAARNNPYSEIHLFVNDDEITCPKINATSYKDFAVAAASVPGEFDGITVHIGLPGVYQDFNGNGQNDSNELQYWPHGNPSINQEQAGDLWYRARLLAGDIPAPVLNARDELFVAGFVKTKRFGFWLGDGQNAAGSLSYELGAETKEFVFSKASVLPVTGVLAVDTADFSGATVELRRNGNLVEAFMGGEVKTVTEVADGETILFTRTGTPTGYEPWSIEKFGAGNPPRSGRLEDHDGDGISNLIEYALNLNPLAADASADRPFAMAAGDGAMDFNFRQRKGGTGTIGVDYLAETVRYTVQTSSDLTEGSWEEGAPLFTLPWTPVDLRDGTERVTVRFPAGASGRRFVRLKITEVP